MQDILAGYHDKLLSDIRERRANMIGETFGSFDSIKDSDEFMNYKLTDRGYLLQFAT